MPRLVQDLVYAHLPALDGWRQRPLDELGEAGLVSQVAAVNLLHMGLLDV